MNPHPILEKAVNGLLNHSLQSGVLIVLVLLVQWFFRRRLTSRWRFALWWIVLVRLLLPFGPQSAVSLFNYCQPSVLVQGPRYGAPALVPAQSSVVRAEPMPPADVSLPAVAPAISPAVEQGNVPVATPLAPSIQKHSPSWSFDDFIIPGLALLWAGGIVLLGVWVAAQVFGFRRKLSKAAASSDSTLAALLDDCRRDFGVTWPIELIETNAVASPALFGLFRLRLLLPVGMAEKFSPREMRYIFLHELAHVKRGDLWLNWLVTALQLVHWFNPLVWLAFARLRADRELACDELALVCAGDQVGESYGETVIKLLEGLSRPATIPGLVGILEDKRQMRRRISMIANFRKPGRWSVLAALLIAVVAAAALTNAQKKVSSDEAGKAETNSPAAPDLAASNAPRPDLIGSVMTRDGKPLPATVFISTAAPKTGISSFCPSCYPDCIKNSKADDAGNFKISSLDPKLTFRVLAVAKGYKPQYVSKVDPAKGPISIALQPIEAADAAPDRSLRGRVVDTHGKPISGAVVEMQGVRDRDGGGNWGELPGIDPLAVADENGEFLLTAKNPFSMMDVKVEARAFAPKYFSLASGATRHDVPLMEGTTVKGRVLFEGKPRSNVVVGISAASRTVDNDLGHYEVGTDSKGVFTFFNIPPDTDFIVGATMGSIKALGAIPIQSFHTARDGEITDVKDLAVGPAHRLGGQVVLADGRPLPPNTRMLVGRDEASDSVELTLDENGRFELTGVPSEIISLHVRLDGYRPSRRNASLAMNMMGLVGRMDGDVTNLIFLLEKGERPRPDHSFIGAESDLPRNRPLRGAEVPPDHSRQWIVSGRVTDQDTGQPVEKFRVVAGTSFYNQTSWDDSHAVNGSNGSYLIYFSKRIAQPLLKVEADGYLPRAITPAPNDVTNQNFTLKRGTGAEGTVLAPDGRPADGASLTLLGGARFQPELRSAGDLTEIEGKADADGRFALKPKWGAYAVAAANSKGFAMVRLDVLATNPIIRLEPFGRIAGSLKRNSGPGTNETLDLAFVDESGLRIANAAITDPHGRFDFDHVPAGRLQISSRLSVDGGWTDESLQEVELKPGQTLEANVQAGDRPKLEANAGQTIPPAKRIAGAEIKGIVLSPDGRPAEGAEVTLKLADKYLALVRGAFDVSDDARQEGFLVNTGPDGRFTLPQFEKAGDVYALNDAGFARVSLEQLKTNSQIRLQKWGRVEGTLRIGRRPGSNEVVAVSAFPPDASELIYNSTAFQFRTDESGRFVAAYLPPGETAFARLVPAGRNAQNQLRLGNVEVKPGETTTVNFGGGEVTVVAQLKYTGTNTAFDFRNTAFALSTPRATAELRSQMEPFKTSEQAAAFRQSDRFKDIMRNSRFCPVTVGADGRLRAEAVPPGSYEIVAQIRPGNVLHSQTVTVKSPRESDAETPVDLGTIELTSTETQPIQWDALAR
jgi:beta-lactamase regulating signal transducer with metallopeptidase domain